MAVSAGNFHTCGITLGGDAYCWGRNDAGQLGDGSEEDAAEPVQVLGGLTFASVDAGFAHTCGVTTDGDAYCWGGNDFGQLGDGSGGSLVPSPVLDGTDYVHISTGGSYSCGLRESGEAWCWGTNQNGQLGRVSAELCDDPGVIDPLGGGGVAGRVPCSLTPAVAAEDLRFTMIRSHTQHTCGLTTSDGVYCWGWGAKGQLGNGESGENYFSVEPVRVARQP
jgi:alpha-tubulin suppressor-like RCC1 family protein